MAVLTIRRYGDPALRTKALPVLVVTPEVRALINDMVETMYDSLGLGLAAPQVGRSVRLIVVADEHGGEALPLIDPVITARGGGLIAEEGCLSLPGVFGKVERAEWVRVEALDGDGQRQRFESRGLRARVIQHEIDHLDGILFIDRLDTISRDRIKRKIKKEGLPAEAPHHALAL